MKQKFDLEKRIEQTLESLDGIQPAEVNPFFYTRLTAKMEKQASPAASSFGWIGNLKWNVALLSLFMALNVASVFLLSGSPQESEPGTEQVSIDAFADDYFSTSDDYEYLKDY